MQAIIELQAHNQINNIHRTYIIIVSPTLFDDYSLTCRYGREGNKLRELPFLFETSSELKVKFRQIIKRRLNAKNRIGTNYKIINKKFDNEFKQNIWQQLKLPRGS